MRRRLLLLAAAVIPRAALKAHLDDVIGDEVGARAAMKQAAIGLVGAECLDLVRANDPGTGAGGLHRGAEIADG